MDENLTNVIEKAVNDFKGNRDNCKDAHLAETYLSLRITEAGYRLDPYPNGKSKPELIARIEALEAERDRTRFFLKQSHDDMIVATFPGLTMKDKREDHLKTCPNCQICAFMAETSTVKQ